MHSTAGVTPIRAQAACGLVVESQPSDRGYLVRRVSSALQPVQLTICCQDRCERLIIGGYRVLAASRAVVVVPPEEVDVPACNTFMMSAQIGM